MKLSIITDQIDQDLEKALQIIQKEGYDHVEIHNVFGKSIEECTEQEAYQIKALLEKYDMTCTNVSSTVFFLCPLYENDVVTLFNDLFYSVKGNVETHLQALENGCKVANIIGCPRIRLFPFRWPDNRKGPFGTEQEIKDITDNMRKAVQIAEKYNITLVVENCPYSHLPKGLMTVQIIKEINSPNLKLLWDPANNFRAFKENVPNEYLNIPLIDELKEIYPYIDHIHIKDYHYDETQVKPFVHKALFEGDIDFDILFKYLLENKYEQSLSLEPEVSFEDALKCMRNMKEYFN